MSKGKAPGAWQLAAVIFGFLLLLSLPGNPAQAARLAPHHHQNSSQVVRTHHQRDYRSASRDHDTPQNPPGSSAGFQPHRSAPVLPRAVTGWARFIHTTSPPNGPPLPVE